MKYLALIASALIASSSYANGSKSLNEYCKSNICRKNLTISLKQKDGTRYTKTFDLLPPAIQPSFITVYAGETIYIEATEGEEGPVNLAQVESNKNPGKTIVFKFEQNAEIRDGKAMLLTVTNPFSKPIRYQMGIMPLDHDKLLKTSSCPVTAKGNAIEMWPFPIFQLVVSDIHFQKQSDEGACK